MNTRRRYNREPPTFAQSVVIIQTMPRSTRTDREAVISRHLALGFSYETDQIHRAMNAVTDSRARRWDHSNRASARST